MQVKAVLLSEPVEKILSFPVVRRTVCQRTNIICFYFLKLIFYEVYISWELLCLSSVQEISCLISFQISKSKSVNMTLQYLVDQTCVNSQNH